MKKFEPVTGGHRFRLDDLMLMQTAFIEAMQGVIATLHPSLSVIMSGAKATVTSGTLNMSEGFVAFKGEVFKVDATSLSYLPLPDRLFLKVDQTILAPSPVTYQDATNNNVHYERKLEVKYYSAADGDDPGVNGAYYDELTQGGNQTPGAVIEWDPMYNGEELEVWDGTGLGIGRMKGWAICNGLNNTPDLRGQFTFQPSVGLFNAAPLLTDTVDGIAAGQRLGKKEISILPTNLPNYNLVVNQQPHTHTTATGWAIYSDTDGAGSSLNNDGGDAVDRDTKTTNGLNSTTIDITVNSGGENTPLTNIPPARAMLKIKRIDY